jgi:hypothetical protein
MAVTQRECITLRRGLRLTRTPVVKMNHRNYLYLTLCVYQLTEAEGAGLYMNQPAQYLKRNS